MRRGMIVAVMAVVVFFLAGPGFANGPIAGEGSGTYGGEAKSPGFAVLLSALVPGLGQVYNDQINKAIFMGAIEGLSWLLVAEDLDEVGALGLGVGRIISGIDAYDSAVKKSKGISLNIDGEKAVIAIKRDF